MLLPYVALTSFVVGHVWRYQRDGYTWTARSTQLLERRLLLVGSVAFHLGILGVIGVILATAIIGANRIGDDLTAEGELGDGLAAPGAVAPDPRKIPYRHLDTTRLDPSSQNPLR